MKSLSGFAMTLTLMAQLCFGPVARGAALLDWPDLLSRPLPAPTKVVSYGDLPDQVAQVWLPAGKGPFPVVLMVHGGCWLSGVAKLSIMNYAAEDLRQRGIAVWNIEYRGVDRPGGGYPGTFEDVAAAADALVRLGPGYGLRTDHVVALGHSAGGHLALWLAARGRIPPGSPLKAANPLHIAAAVSLGGLPDLEAVHAQGICGAVTVEKLVGHSAAHHGSVWSDTSPAELGAGRDREVLISGDEDRIAPPALADAYAAKMKARGADIRAVTLADTGHVELIAPGTPAWSEAIRTVESLLRER
jgi:acetyl esterase/lipase